MSALMDCYGLSDIGRVREENQDQFLIADLKKSVTIHHTSLSYDDETELLGGSQAQLLVVADGVGGNPGGRRASMLAVEGTVQYLLNMMHWLFRLEENREGEFFEGLKSALAFSQEKIQHAAEAVPHEQGMATTITLAYVVWPSVYLVHVGDSRAYLYRNSRLIQLTHDQSIAQMLADIGAITPEQIAEHPFHHVLGSLLGCNPDELQPTVHKESLALNDKLLLCTDGLTRHLDDSQIREVLTVDSSAETICRQLTTAANEAGGRDNTTVVVAHFKDRINQQTEDMMVEAARGEEAAPADSTAGAIPP